MSKLNINRKVFLEQEELNRFQEFLNDNTIFNAIIGNTRQYGIIQTNFVSNDTNFQVGLGTNPGSIQIAKTRNQAIDIDGNLIRLEATDNIPITEDGNWYWVRISHTYRKYESGIISINNLGQLTGNNTKFTEILRGQATDVPVRIKFQNIDGTIPSNNGTYEVVSITDDTNALLTSVTAFTTESNLRYIVIGSTPIGEIISPEQSEGLYFYDACLIALVQETVADMPPTLPPNGTNRYFYIARVVNNSGILTIQDKRSIDTSYWQFNIPGVIGAIVNRPIIAPTTLDNYLFIGAINNIGSQFVYFIVTGLGSLQGYIAYLRLFHVNPPGIDVHGVNIMVMRNAGNQNRDPIYYTRLNTVDNTIELWVKSPSQEIELGAGFMPGTIGLVADNIMGGATNWTYNDEFLWINTEPSNLVAGSIVYNVYSEVGTIQNINNNLNGLSTLINNNTSRIVDLEINIDPESLLPRTEITDIDSQITRNGNVINIYFEFEVNTAIGYSPFTIFELPANIRFQAKINPMSCILSTRDNEIMLVRISSQYVTMYSNPGTEVLDRIYHGACSYLI